MQARNTTPTCKATSNRSYDADEITCLISKDTAVTEVQATQRQQDLDYHASGIHDQHQAEVLRQRDWTQTFAFSCIFAAAFFQKIAITFVPYMWNLNKRPVPEISYSSLVGRGLYIISVLLGGLLADSKLGRFNVIIGAALLNVFAATFLGLYFAFSSTVTSAIFYFAAILFIFGCGGAELSFLTFGADQIDAVDRKRIEKFFLWIFWVLKIGGLLGKAGFFFIQKYNFNFISYVICASLMIVGVAVFALGRKSYVTIPLLDGYALDAFKIIWSAMISSMCRQRARAVQVESWLDRAKRRFGGLFFDTQVEDIKLLLKIFPIYLATTMFWAIYFQMWNIFNYQGTYMDLRSVKANIILWVTALASNNVVIIIIIPVIDKCVFPLLAHCGVRLTPLKKMGAGMLFAAASAGVACFVEMERKKSKYGTFQQELFNSTVNASHMSVFYQIPQYMLLGIAEVLISVTGCEFAYKESPRYIHSLIIAVSFAIKEAGLFLSIPILHSVRLFQWQEIDLNQESLEYYLFSIVFLTVAIFLVFAAISSKYRYQYLPTPDERMRHFNLLNQRNS